jgi:hypothetical protein
MERGCKQERDTPTLPPTNTDKHDKERRNREGEVSDIGIIGDIMRGSIMQKIRNGKGMALRMVEETRLRGLPVATEQELLHKTHKIHVRNQLLKVGKRVYTVKIILIEVENGTLWKAAFSSPQEIKFHLSNFIVFKWVKIRVSLYPSL